MKNILDKMNKSKAILLGKNIKMFKESYSGMRLSREDMCEMLENLGLNENVGITWTPSKLEETETRQRETTWDDGEAYDFNLGFRWEYEEVTLGGYIYYIYDNNKNILITDIELDEDCRGF